MTWYDMMWHDMTWYDMIWHDMTWYDMTWLPTEYGETNVFKQLEERMGMSIFFPYNPNIFSFKTGRIKFNDLSRRTMSSATLGRRSAHRETLHMTETEHAHKSSWRHCWHHALTVPVQLDKLPYGKLLRTHNLQTLQRLLSWDQVFHADDALFSNVSTAAALSRGLLNPK